MRTAKVSRANDDETGVTTLQFAIDLRDPVPVPRVQHPLLERGENREFLGDRVDVASPRDREGFGGRREPSAPGTSVRGTITSPW